MERLTFIELQFLLALVTDSDTYNDGGRLAGDLANKLEDETRTRLTMAVA